MSLPKQWKKEFAELLKSPIITSRNGLILRLKYTNEHDELHKNSEIGSAFIYYYENGNIYYKQYWVNGKKRRLDDPAYISYYKNGNISYKQYYVNGERK